jgi:hypothetical protein
VEGPRISPFASLARPQAFCAPKEKDAVPEQFSTHRLLVCTLEGHLYTFDLSYLYELQNATDLEESLNLSQGAGESELVRKGSSNSSAFSSEFD